MLFGIAPVEGLAGGGLTRLSVTFSELTSWLELLSDTDVPALFTDNVLNDILLVASLFFSILDELMLTILVRISDLTIRAVKLLTKLADVDIVAELIRVIKSVIVARDSDSCRSVSMPESKRRSYWETDRALNELSLEFSDLRNRFLNVKGQCQEYHLCLY